MKKRRKAAGTTSLQHLTQYMSALLPDRKRLTEIQAVYDNLTLLGQLLGAGTDITKMREDFSNLATLLLEQLAQEHYKKATLNLVACARVSIDVLTRNLYERTADIGFLATDHDICAFAEAVAADPAAREDMQWQSLLLSRFTEYVNKYSVYHNIVILSTQGDVLVQLDGNNPATRTTDSFLGEALTTDAGYVEVFRPTDLLPGVESPLIYAYRIMAQDGSRPVGVLCLCFRFQDECKRIFESLMSEDDWTVITMLDTSGRIIASSDLHQFPIGVRIEPVPGDDCRIIRFDGREYLATSRKARGYQGYGGPGWYGHAMAPLNHAFELSEPYELADVPDALLNCVLESATIFSQELRDIPVKAASIQQELNRAVWNGNIWLTSDRHATNAEFAKVLLREIGSAGIRTRNVYGESTTNLYKTIVSSVLFDCSSQAALAIDIMDRNLYERANDCRWWALTRLFRDELGNLGRDGEALRSHFTEVLRKINSLYTVYEDLLLFDHTGRVVAVSNSAYNDLLGNALTEDWVRPTLGLKDTQDYSVSRFQSSELYDARPTYIYSAAIRTTGNQEPAGGIAIVFDAQPQFLAMLRDSLPRQVDGQIVPGAFAVFVERTGRIISSTDDRLVPGTHLEIDLDIRLLQRNEGYSHIIVYNDCYYAVGACMGSGYREYNVETAPKPNDVAALVFVPLSDRTLDPGNTGFARSNPAGSYTLRQAKGEDTVDVACFYIGQNWYGIRSSFVVEAIDNQTLTSMPGAPEWVKGCLMFRDEALTVFDFARISPAPKMPEERRLARRAAVDRRQLLVLKSADEKMRFAIQVDSLGDISSYPASYLEQVPNMMADGSSLVESIVKPHEGDTERRILMVLSPQKMLDRLAQQGK